MLVDPKSFSDAHFNTMLKVVRAGDVKVFCDHFEKKDFPKVKFGPAETKVKEKFWNDLISATLAKGILQPAVAGKVAA